MQHIKVFCQFQFRIMDVAICVGHEYRIRGNFRGLPIFAVFRGQYNSAKIKTAKYFPIFVKESSLEATSIFAAVTRSFSLLH